MSEVPIKDLQRMKRDAGLEYLPTQFTYQFRQAIEGAGPREADWLNKPHRLVYDLCRYIEELEGKSK